jgi:hypothetical protein
MKQVSEPRTGRVTAADAAAGTLTIYPWPHGAPHPLKSRLDAARAAAAAEEAEEEGHWGGGSYGRQLHSEAAEAAAMEVLATTDYDAGGVLTTAVGNLEMRLVSAAVAAPKAAAVAGGAAAAVAAAGLRRPVVRDDELGGGLLGSWARGVIRCDC